MNGIEITLNAIVMSAYFIQFPLLLEHTTSTHSSTDLHREIWVNGLYIAVTIVTFTFSIVKTFTIYNLCSYYYTINPDRENNELSKHF